MSKTFLLALLLLAAPAAARAQDRDRDGIPGAVEARLGTNPDLGEGLQVVINKAPGKDAGAPRVVQVLMAHVAGGRFLWKIVFAAPHPKQGTILHLYVDLDGDRTNGRQDAEWARGVDAMYTFIDGAFQPRIFTPGAREDPDLPPRGLIEGNAAYVCDDIKPAVTAGRTRFRLMVLSQLKAQQTVSDSTGWAEAEVPLHEERKMPDLDILRQQGFDALSLPDFAQLTYNLWHDPRTHRLRPKDATVAGYTVLMNDDLDGKGEGAESATWQCPAAGDYHLGLILRETVGQRPALELLAAGKKVGTVVGRGLAAREVLETSRESVRLRKGDAIVVRTPAEGGPVRFHSLCLLAEKPRVPPLAIANLAAWHLPDEPGERPGRILVAWTTNRPADGMVRYSLAGPEARVESGTLTEGRGMVNNHVLLLPATMRASGYKLAITSREPDGVGYPTQPAAASYTVWTNPAQDRRQHGVQAPGPAGVVRVALSVHEPAAQGRAAWPVSSGVPLKEGALAEPERCRLLDAAGKPVPAQFQALAWWPNSGTVKWLLVSFLAQTTAGPARGAAALAADAAYTLEVGAAPEPAGRGIVIRQPAAPAEADRPVGVAALPLTVDTGRLSLEVGQGGFAPFAGVRLDGKPVTGLPSARCGFEVTDDVGTVYSTALLPPEQVLIEDAGPVAATICVRGRFGGADGRAYLRYLCRLRFAAGQPAVRVAFTLDDDAGQPAMTLLRSLRVRVPAALAGAVFTTGADGATLPLKAGDRLLQDNDDHFDAAGRAGKRADGWLAARAPGALLAVAVRDFWQLYPKALSADDEGVVIDLLPALPADQYAGASEDDVDKLTFWCDKGRYKIRPGIRLTTEFAADFAPAPATDGSWPDGAHWQQPLFAACTPEYYCSTGAFGPMAPRAAGKFGAYEGKLDAAFAKFHDRREKVREYGFMNYGDWFGERTWNWGNIEYDTQSALALNFARTGNLAMLRRAEEAERHNADVDTVHWAANPAEIGRAYEHCTGHTGGYFPADWKKMGWFNSGPHDTGHTWAQGHFLLYALTGERRYLETGRQVADWLVNNTTDFRYGTERNAGWPLIAVMGSYNVSGNPVYLNAGKLIADTVMWTQPERGGWGHFQDPNECKHDPRCWGCKPFMTGVLLHGLKLYDLAQPRPDIEETIRRNCDFLWREMYVPRDKGFAYSECKSFITKGNPWTISLVGDGLAYGCLLDPQHKNRALLQEATDAFFAGSMSEFGKTFTQYTCFTPLMLHDLDALGLSGKGNGR